MITDDDFAVFTVNVPKAYVMRLSFNIQVMYSDDSLCDAVDFQREPKNVFERTNVLISS